MQKENVESSIVSTISAKELQISKIFSSDFSFEIPSYQRPYSWQAEHATQLLDDIAEFALKDEKFNDLSPYFVGSLVLIKENEKRKAKVVDGQQRLTTFTILFSCLRHLLKDRKWKDSVTKYIYEEGSLIERTQDDFRLKLRSKDQEYFNSVIQLESGLENLDLISDVSESQERIRENANALLIRLKDFTQAQLQTLVQFIGTRCFLVIVCSTDEDSAFRIFNVLNDRGLQLSHADILKSEVLEKIERFDSGLLEAYTVKWETAEETIGIDKFKELFNHIRPIYAKKKAEESILKEIRKFVKPSENPVDFVDKVIIPYTDVYNYILKCNYPATKYAELINNKLKWLNRIENTDWIPATLVYMSKFKANPEKIYQFLSQLEKLVIGMEILSYNINDRISTFADIITVIESNDDILGSETFYFTKKDEEKIQNKLLSNSLYGRRYLKILLLKIDEKLSGGGASYEYPILSIEHVLPQSPKEGSKWTKWFNDKEREELVNSMGNFVILTTKKNSSARNFELDVKKEKYFNQNGVSPLPLTTSILKYDKWSPEIVKIRTHELANHVLEILGLSQVENSITLN